MAVLNAQYKHPQSAYSQGLRDLIDSMLKVNPTDRPDINQVCWLTFLISRRDANYANHAGHCTDRSGHSKPDMRNNYLLQTLHCCVCIFTFIIISGSLFLHYASIFIVPVDTLSAFYTLFGFNSNTRSMSRLWTQTCFYLLERKLVCTEEVQHYQNPVLYASSSDCLVGTRLW